MKFKILKATKLFKLLIELQNEMKRCNKLAYDITESLGYKSMRGKFGTLAGGISSIVIEDKKPNNWRKCNTGSKEYFPMKRKANEDLLNKISALPVVEYDDLNKLVKFDPFDREGRHINFHPGISWHKNYVLISISDYYTRYKPVKDMIEILESEYNKLSTPKTKKQ